MNALVLANFPIAFLIFAAIVGIPLWLTFKRPDRAPRYGGTPADATAAVPAHAAAGTASRTAPPRVSPARQHAAARTAVPGRQHAAPAGAVRSHAASGQAASARAASGQAAGRPDHAAA
jgi:hypothetical protein